MSPRFPGKEESAKKREVKDSYHSAGEARC